MWKHRHLVLAAIGIFVYVGAEVSIGSFLINYFSQANIGKKFGGVDAGYVSILLGRAMVTVSSAPLFFRNHHRRGAGDRALVAVPLVASLCWPWLCRDVDHHSCRPFNSVMFPSIFTLGIANWGRYWGWLRPVGHGNCRRRDHLLSKSARRPVSVLITVDSRRSAICTSPTMRSGDHGR